jgi:predicted nucleic acid-binding protein
MYLLDTDTLTHLYAGQPNVIERLRSVDDPDVGITIITKGEVLRGRIDYLLKAQTGADLLKAQSLLFRSEELLNQLLIVPVSQAASEQFERLRIIIIFSDFMISYPIILVDNFRFYRSPYEKKDILTEKNGYKLTKIYSHNTSMIKVYGF